MTLRVWRRLFVVGLAVVVLQVGALDQLDIADAHPDTFLLLAICAGVVAGPQYGAVVAFVVGLVADLFVLTPFGLSALCYVLIAFVVGSVAAAPGGRAPYTFRVVAAFVASVGGVLLYAGLSIVVGEPRLPAGQLFDVVIVVAVANAVLAVPGVAAMRWVFSGSAQAGRELAGMGGTR
ncbi:MAG TPA: rod shape-determining protein MreD [Acidimicrobiales bacterium]|nr:rod shape-determining protein MreD [Acidimicrobiales bacterium]